MEEFAGIIAILCIFVILPWMFLHYSSQWKKGRSISADDEQLLDDLYHVAQRLDDRIGTIERIMDADDPDWRRLAPASQQETLDEKIANRSTNIRRAS